MVSPHHRYFIGIFPEPEFLSRVAERVRTRRDQLQVFREIVTHLPGQIHGMLVDIPAGIIHLAHDIELRKLIHVLFIIPQFAILGTKRDSPAHAVGITHHVQLVRVVLLVCHATGYPDLSREFIVHSRDFHAGRIALILFSLHVSPLIGIPEGSVITDIFRSPAYTQRMIVRKDIFRQYLQPIGIHRFVPLCLPGKFIETDDSILVVIQVCLFITDPVVCTIINSRVTHAHLHQFS